MTNEQVAQIEEDMKAKAELAATAIGKEALEVLVLITKDLAKHSAEKSDFYSVMRLTLNAATRQIPMSNQFRKALKRELDRIAVEFKKQEDAPKVIANPPAKRLIILP